MIFFLKGEMEKNHRSNLNFTSNSRNQLKFPKGHRTRIKRLAFSLASHTF